MVLTELRDELRADYRPEHSETKLLDDIRAIFVKTFPGNPLRSYDDALNMLDRLLQTSSVNVAIDPSGSGANITWWPFGLSGRTEVRAQAIGYPSPRLLVECLLTLLIDTQQSDLSTEDEYTHYQSGSSPNYKLEIIEKGFINFTNPAFPHEVAMRSDNGYQKLPRADVMTEIEDRLLLAFGAKANLGNYAALHIVVPGVVERSGRWARLGPSFRFQHKEDAEMFYETFKK